MPLWKRILLRSVGFGAGFALMLCIVAGTWTWYKSRPKAWNKGAIKAKYASLEFTENDQSVVAQFGYDLENDTRFNYAVERTNLVILARLSDTNSLSKSFGDYQAGEPTLEVPDFIPPQGTVRIDIRVPYSYDGLDNPKDKDDKGKMVKYIAKRLKSISGLVMFDQANHYQIEMGSGWHDIKE
jgi:hypothetical protein